MFRIVKFIAGLAGWVAYRSRKDGGRSIILRKLATDERVQRLEDALTSLDHDVRVRLGIGKSEAGLSSLPESSEGPAARESEPAESPSPARIRAR